MSITGTPVRPSPVEGASRLTWYAAGLSVAASILHGLVAPQHFTEWWGYGAFFVVAALAQMGFATLLLIAPWRYDATGGLRADGDGGALRLYRLYLLLGVAGNAAIVVMYVVTRTVGIPILGPEAGEVEPVGPIDVVSKTIEVVLIGVLLRLRHLAHWSTRRSMERRDAPRAAAPSRWRAPFGGGGA